MEPDCLSSELTEMLGAARMTAEALSLKAQLGRDTVGRWIRGDTVPSLATLRRVEEVLGSKLGSVVDLSAARGERRAARSPVPGDKEGSSLARLAARRSVPYVRRPILERALSGLLNERPRVIAVAGPPSTGKRSLVGRVLADLGISSVIVIDGSDPELARYGMVEALHDWWGIPYEKVGALPQYQLRTVLESAGGPDYLVVENAADSGWLDFFATVRTRVTIVVTTTRRLRGVDGSHHVDVGAMEPDEAAELARTLLPAATQQDAQELTRLLGHQVLPVIAACGMIRHSAGGSVPEFCRNLSRNMAAVFDGELPSPGSRDQPALTQIYRNTLLDLERENPQALAALELAAYLGEETAPSAFIVFALASRLGIDPADSVHRSTIAQRAANALRDRYLVSIDERGVLSVPDVTRRIIRDLVHDRGSQISAHLRRGLLAFVSQTREVLPDKPLMDFLRLHTTTLFHLTHTHIDPKKEPGRLVDYVYCYAAALTGLLEAIGIPAWRVAIIVFETSLESYSVALMDLPEKMATVARPRLTISWDDPEPHHLEYEMRDWENRKAMQVIVVDRSGTALRDLEESLAGH